MLVFHGGAPGRKLGELLLPADRTGLVWTSRAINEAAGLETPHYREDRVYGTTDRNLAHAFAGYWTREPNRPGGGWLYQVEFDDAEVEVDEDFPSLSSVSYQAPQGVVVAVLQTGIGWQQRRHGATFDRILEESNRRARERATEEPTS